jgi:DNA-binding NarL/FixJ family response regulator
LLGKERPISRRSAYRCTAGRTGPLKDRIADVGEFLTALRRVADGGTALDPEAVAQLLLRRRSAPLARLSPRETEVLRYMAEGRSNAGVADLLMVSESAVAKHVNDIFAKLDLPMAGQRPPPGAGRADLPEGLTMLRASLPGRCAGGRR